MSQTTGQSTAVRRVIFLLVRQLRRKQSREPTGPKAGVRAIEPRAGLQSNQIGLILLFLQILWRAHQ